MNYQVLIIDSPYLAHRSFETKFQLTTSAGLNSTLFHNFIRTVGSLKKMFEPQEILFAYESHGSSSWRRELYPDYKPQNHFNQHYVNDVKELQIFLCLFGYKQYFSPHNEADDVIANLCEKHSDKDVLIYTVDKDMLQLVDERTHVYNDRQKKIYDVDLVKYNFRVYPNQIPDLLAIWGDTSDNIEGIEKYGFVKSAELLKKYKYVENIPETEPIFKHMEKLRVNKKLATLNSVCSVISYNPHTYGTLNDLLDKYQLNQIKDNIELYKNIPGKETGQTSLFQNLEEPKV